MTSLAHAFGTGTSRKTKWQGQVVHAVLQVDVKDGDTIEIRRIATSDHRAQALKVGVDKGELRANGVLVSTAAIWSHTAPEVVSLEVVGRKARSVDVWNSWSFDGVDSSWLGNAGMIVEATGNTYMLRCSDGLGEPVFEDLVVQLKVTKGG